MLNRGLDKLELLRIVEAVANEKSIDKELIINQMLNKIEKNWLNNYHQKVFLNLKKFMNKFEILELKKACSAI